MNDRLLSLGFSEEIIQESVQYKELFPGRVIAQYKGLYRVATENSEMAAEISGKFRHLAAALSDYPAVGDFVMLDRVNNLSGNAIIHHVLARKSVFIRRAAGTANDVQTVAANIDIVFICMSLNKDFNLRRLERYLSITWDSGATPVIVLTKSDLCGEIALKLSEIQVIAAGVDIVTTSSIVADGYKPIIKYLAPGKTVAFIGSSGVGKSTLINQLIGRELIETKETGKDDKGRHATTRRELMIIPAGGAVIDTPGMRELGIESANFTKTFADINELARKCKFSNCQHINEPNCAVRKAVEDGLITEGRLLSYQKLKKEAKYEDLNFKQIEKEKINTMFADVGGIRNARALIKSKSRKQQ
ncbi:MAG TPA: ribosome small subunit-dependent GTPase A [Desulfotomaculum sp.]|nr:MAG: Putative ribosome biogenesis GTPase RsgA [Desulfotomaculum sp. 46_80]HBY03408.1 ribosome small subunit-dependent GTPase A [Desulfotomaculum sp.]